MSRRKIAIWAFAGLASLLICLTVFGSWDTYRIPGRSDMFSQEVSVTDLPVWIGSLMKKFNPNILTQHESDVIHSEIIIMRIAQLKERRNTAPERYFESIELMIEWYQKDLDRINKRLDKVKED